VKGLREVLRCISLTLPQPPQHKGNLNVRQIVCQHFERNVATPFRKGGPQTRFNNLRAQVENTPQDRKVLAALKEQEAKTEPTAFTLQSPCRMDAQLITIN